MSRSASLITFFHPAEEPLSILPSPTLSNNNPSQASSTSPKQTKKPLINIGYIYKSSLNAELCCGYGRHSPRAWQSSHCVSPRENLHNTYRDRDRPPLWQQTTRAKINCSSFLCLSLSSHCRSVYMPAGDLQRGFILIEVKSEDVERGLFTHAALTDRNLHDPISPVATHTITQLAYTYGSHTNAQHMIETVVTDRLLLPRPKTSLTFIRASVGDHTSCEGFRKSM